MQRSRLFWLITLLLFGCSAGLTQLRSPSPTVAPVTESVPTLTAPTPTASPDLAAQIRNAEYQLGASSVPKTVQLTDGKFQQGEPGDPDYSVVTLTNFVASGDLN